jgi:hypothetical protein
MNSFAAFVAVLALAVPAPAAVFAPATRAVHEARSATPPAKFGGVRPESEPFRSFRDSYRPEAQHQVHIEERVIIRLAPTSPTVRRRMVPPAPRGDGPARYKEKKVGRCVPIDDIVGIAPTRPNRLLLFMRDHRLLSAALERACDADAFYLGAYVDRSDDGRLCTGRDTLRARTGATCQISRISRLVAIKD